MPGGHEAAIGGDIPESLTAWERTRGEEPHEIAQLVKAAPFSCRARPRGLGDVYTQYSWTALHVAAKRGNIRAVETLIVWGADPEEACAGICDCLIPAPRDSWRWGRQPLPPSWGALHVAICCGHEDIVRELLDWGASYLEPGEPSTNAPRLLVSQKNSVTALHSAASRGNVAMCQLLLDHHLAKEGLPGSLPQRAAVVLAREDARHLSALDYAVAAGHTRTTGSWLLDHGADPFQHGARRERIFLAPLDFLCSWGHYRDAQYLLARTPCTPAPAHLTMALQSCFMPPGATFAPPQLAPRPLCHLVNEYMSVGCERAWHGTSDGEEALTCLVKQLLEAGADPTIVIDDSSSSNEDDILPVTHNEPALNLAAAASQRAALEVLLDAGVLLEPDLMDARGPGLLTAAMRGSRRIGVNESRMYLETIITLLERGASFKKTMPFKRTPEEDTGPRDWLAILFKCHPLGHAWHHSSRFDLFERVMELIAKQLGKEHVPLDWAVDLLYLGVMHGAGVDFCQWYVLVTPHTSSQMNLLTVIGDGNRLVQRYNVVPADIPSNYRESFTPLAPSENRFRDPRVMEWILDFIPEISTALVFNTGYPHPALAFAEDGDLGCAKVLVERGLADKASLGTSGVVGAFERLVTARFRKIVFMACQRHTEEGAAGLISAVFDRASSLQLGGLSKLLTLGAQLAASLVICSDTDRYAATSLPSTVQVLTVLLKHQRALYGVKGRTRGERPWVREYWVNNATAHPFHYPVPIAIDTGRADLLELIFKHAAPPTPAEAQEALAMSLDTTSQEPDPAVIRTILEHTWASATKLIRLSSQVPNSVREEAPPLYYLLETFYEHVMPKTTTTTSSSPPPSPLSSSYDDDDDDDDDDFGEDDDDDDESTAPEPKAHVCDCPVITREKYLVRSIGVLLRHGADWRQPSKPDGGTALDMLEAILDGEGCDQEAWGVWPGHCWDELRRRVGGRDVRGEGLGEVNWD